MLCGLNVSVFIQISLEKQTKDALDVFEAAIKERPEVMERYLMSGDSNFCCESSLTMFKPSSVSSSTNSSQSPLLRTSVQVLRSNK